VIFVDTSFLVAIASPRDADHETATKLMGSLTEADRLMTTNHVLGETWTHLQRRMSRDYALAVLDALESSDRYTIDHVGPDLEVEALDWLRQHDEREYSFVDATSFAYMRARRIEAALAFDGDFAAAGFVELR
jgi:uncharacterized protein